MIWFLCLVLCLGVALGKVMDGVVIRVLDGDTVSVLEKRADGRKVEHRVRLTDIDAPEKGQDFAEEAKAYLERLVWGERVKVKYDNTDKHGRILGDIIVNGMSAQTEMARQGLVWRWRHSRNEEIGRLERAARGARKGIWSKPNPVDPYDWKQLRVNR